MEEIQIVSIMKKDYGKIPARIIAENCGVDLREIYNLARKHKIKTSKSRNKEISELTHMQKQILLSGIIGDGSYRKQGFGYQYREQHASNQRNIANGNTTI